MSPRELTTLRHLETLASNHEHLNYGDIKNVIEHLVPNLPISTDGHDKLFRPKEGTFERDPSILCRARVNQIHSKGSSMIMPFQSVKDISIVPEEKRQYIPTGRCNLKKEAIFYCSNYSLTACIESASQGFTKDFKSLTVTLGMWRIKKILHLAEMAFSVKTLKELEKQTDFSYDTIHNYNHGWYENAKSQLNGLNKGMHSTEFVVAVLEYFSDQFGKTDIKKESDYFISNVYSDVVFNHSTANEIGTLYDGIMYPSVRNALQEFNLGLHPRALPKLEFVCAEQIWITKGQDRKIHFNSLERAFSDPDGNLKWNHFLVREEDIIHQQK